MKLFISNFFILLLLLPHQSLAQEHPALKGLRKAGEGSGLITNRGPAEIIAMIINSLLGILGTLFTILIIWSGFKWMTSQGNSDQVASAKKTISNATIGLVIVVISYAVVNFILSRLVEETPTGGGTG